MRRTRQVKWFSGLVGLFLLSATCAGFLVGRSVRLQQEGKYQQYQQPTQQLASPDYVLERGAQILRRALLR
jgi:hypothetical protein